MNTAKLKTMTEDELAEYIIQQKTVVDRLRQQLRTETFDLLIAQDEYLERGQRPKAGA